VIPVYGADLQVALERYHRPFLDGEDSSWAIEERERLHSLFVRAAMDLVRYFGPHRDTRPAYSWARVLTLDPYREAAARVLLILLCLDDRRGELCGFMSRWRKVLRQELGVEPMPATVELMKRFVNYATKARLDALNCISFLKLGLWILSRSFPCCQVLRRVGRARHPAGTSSGRRFANCDFTVSIFQENFYCDVLAGDWPSTASESASGYAPLHEEQP